MQETEDDDFLCHFGGGDDSCSQTANCTNQQFHHNGEDESTTQPIDHNSAEYKICKGAFKNVYSSIKKETLKLKASLIPLKPNSKDGEKEG